MQYVVLKAQRREGTRFNWRNAQSNWRWLFGMPPLLDPGQRLADHYTWIQAERERQPGAATQGHAALENGQQAEAPAPRQSNFSGAPAAML
jgi:hypothetical protein